MGGKSVSLAKGEKSKAEKPKGKKSTGARFRDLSLWFVLVAIVSLFFADIFLYQPDPWEEFTRIGWGMVTPFWPAEQWFRTLSDLASESLVVPDTPVRSQ